MSRVGSKLRCAVVGVGHLGRFHAQKYKALPEVDLVAVCDQRVEQGGKIAEEMGVPLVIDYRDLVGKVNAVTVATNTPSHFEICKFFLEKDIHINVEKPMTTTSREGEVLCELAEKKGLKFQVGHVERFNPALVAARAKLNRPLFIEVHRLAPFKPRSLDVDVVIDVMIHDLDVILSLVKSDPIHVSAVGTPVITKLVDIANARIEFASGTVANITASRVSQSAQRKFRVFQKDQYLSIDFGSGEVNLTTKTGEWVDGDVPLELDSWSLEKGDALLAETQSFVDAIQKNQPVVVSGRDGLKALRLAEQILEDIKRRQP